MMSKLTILSQHMDELWILQVFTVNSAWVFWVQPKHLQLALVLWTTRDKLDLTKMLAKLAWFLAGIVTLNISVPNGFRRRGQVREIFPWTWMHAHNFMGSHVFQSGLEPWSWPHYQRWKYTGREKCAKLLVFEKKKKNISECECESD